MEWHPYSKETQLRGHQKAKDTPKFKKKRYPAKKKAKQPYTGEKNYKPNMRTRKNFSAEVKKQAYEMYGYKCGNCRVRPIDDPHHIRHRSDSGKGVLTNCLPVCRPCHDEIHRNAELDMKWKQWAKDTYGHDYWQDEWDKQSLKKELYRDYGG